MCADSKTLKADEAPAAKRGVRVAAFSLVEVMVALAIFFMAVFDPGAALDRAQQRAVVAEPEASGRGHGWRLFSVSDESTFGRFAVGNV